MKTKQKMETTDVRFRKSIQTQRSGSVEQIDLLKKNIGKIAQKFPKFKFNII